MIASMAQFKPESVVATGSAKVSSENVLTVATYEAVKEVVTRMFPNRIEDMVMSDTCLSVELKGSEGAYDLLKVGAGFGFKLSGVMFKSPVAKNLVVVSFYL